jgi:type I restriction enzyme M protein
MKLSLGKGLKLESRGESLKVALTKADPQSSSLEQVLWTSAIKMRGNLEAAEYKHVLLGLVFLKYVSDSFEERRNFLIGATADPSNKEYFVPNESRREAIIEDRNEYLSENVFWIPENARWDHLQSNAKQASIGVTIDNAMDLIEAENPRLRGVLPKQYARAEIDKRRLGMLVDLIGSIGFTKIDHGSDDVLGRVYEYFLRQFASSEGTRAGEYYTPRSVVELLVELIQPFKGRIYDPCCGSGGMFIQSAEFITAHGGQSNDISVYGQEFTASTWRLAKMNLAIRGIEANLGEESKDTFFEDVFPDLRADFILANPPFNDSGWFRKSDDVRWKYGLAPVGNANFAWIQHIIHHLAPKGKAAFILANVALTSDSAEEEAIRTQILKDNLVDSIITLPDKLFFSTPIPVSIWVIDKSRKSAGNKDILFIDASKLGSNLSRTEKILTEDDLDRISSTHHNWKSGSGYKEEIGFSRSISVDEIIERGSKLLPASYVIGDGPKAGRSKSTFNSLESDLANEARAALAKASKLHPDLEDTIESIKKVANSLASKIEYKVVKLHEVLTQSKERLGDQDEPEILTCTESGGLILQRERFASRIATEDSSKYKVVKKGDIVYNPYLLWKGSIDQNWIVDIGITSPAYEIFSVKEGWHRTLVGEILCSDELIRRYDGISFGTVQRRRRAAPENFLEMEIRVPVGDAADQIAKLLELIRECQDAGRSTERSFRELSSLISLELE